MARVQFEHVYKLFGKVEVVHDVSIDIKDKNFRPGWPLWLWQKYLSSYGCWP